ncbi:MAG: hypothetical protein LUE89_06325 [Clostridiales bacterium]|nr:hypothetical protein [Clostridiales bacterium]
MSKFLEDAKQLDQLASDYRLTALSVDVAKKEAAEILDAISARIQQEQAHNEERRAELQAAVDDKSRSEVVRKMAGLELERLEGTTPTVTQEERALFAEKINEANAALSELRKIGSQLTAARSALKRQVDEDFKLSSLSKFDALLLSRHVEGVQERFERSFGKRV